MPENKVRACFRCNAAKGNRTPEEWREGVSVRRRLTPEERIDRAMLEDELLTLVLDTASLLGWMCVHTRLSHLGIVQGNVGFPDLVLAKPGRLLFVELKRETARYGPGQERWLEVLGTSAETHTWRPSDWRTGLIEKVLREAA